jgi:ADP-ribose pyrophosphatase
LQHWRTLSSTIAHQNDWVTLRHDTVALPDGRVVADYNVVVEYDVGCVVALTTEGRILLCEQYKHAIGEVTFEIPGGIFHRRDADPETEARRELAEETGYTAPTLYSLGKLAISPARLQQWMYLFAAPDAAQVGEQQLDAQEDIRVHALPIAEVNAMLRDGRICAATTVAGIALALDFFRRNGHIE